MHPAPLACWLLTATLLAAADAPQGDAPARDPQPQVQRPQRDRANAQGGNSENPRAQRQTERTPAAPQLSGWIYIPPQGGQNGPIPPKPDFVPGNPGQEPAKAGRNVQPQFGNGPVNPNEANRGGVQPPTQPQRRANGLTPDEQHKLQTTMEKLKDDAAIKEARERSVLARKEAEEAAKKERELTEAAALKLDPSLAPIFEKMHQAFAAQNQARQNGTAPSPDEIAAFREKMRARQNEQPQVRRGEQAPTRRDEPAR